MSLIAALGEWREEEQMFKATSAHIGSLGAAGARLVIEMKKVKEA